MNPDVSPVFAHNPVYRECEVLFKRLQDLHGAKRGNTDEADGLRADLETRWRSLSAAEVDRLEGLSGDLYMFSRDEVFEPLGDLEGKSLESLWSHSDYERDLKLLRRGPLKTGAALAYLRGRCWMQLGHFQVALWFFDLAARLNPSDPSSIAMAFQVIGKGGLFEAEQARFARVRNKPTPAPMVLLAAANALYDCANAFQGKASRRALREVIELVELATAQIRFNKVAPPDDEWWVLGGICRAQALSRLEQIDDARKAFTNIVKAYPVQPSGWTLFGVFELKWRIADALAYFERAVALNTKYVWPYMYLAAVRLDQERLDDAIRLAQSGLKLTQDPSVIARLNAVLGEAGLKLDEATDSSIQDAVASAKLLPDNRPVRRRLVLVENLVPAFRDQAFSQAPDVEPRQAA